MIDKELEKGKELAREQSLKNAISRVINSNTDKVKKYQSGDESVLGFFLDEVLSAFPDDMTAGSLLKPVCEALKHWKEPKSYGLYVNSVTFKRDMIPFKEGEQFHFFPGVNLLVGDQGCGKSTMLHVMMYDKSEYGEVVEVDRNPFVGDYVYLDTEKHNPRNLAGESGGRTDVAAVREFLIHAIEKGMASKEWIEEAESQMKKWLEKFGGEDKIMNDHLVYRFKSHGETLLPMLQSFVDKKNGLIYIDEPETALSVRSQYKFVDIIKEAVEKKNQLFIATHSTIIMDNLADIVPNTPQVLSLEHRKWMSPQEFKKTQLPQI